MDGIGYFPSWAARCNTILCNLSCNFARGEMHQARRFGLQFEVYGALGFALPGCSAPRTWHVTLKDFLETDELCTISAYK